MWYEAEITIPAGTAQASPTIVELHVAYGIIHRVVVEAAPGCHRLAAIRLYYSEHQIYPSNPDEDIALDAVPRIFEDRQPVLQPPFIVKIKGYSPSATYAHTYRVGIGIMAPEAFPEYRADTGILSKVGRLLGVSK